MDMPYIFISQDRPSKSSSIVAIIIIIIIIIIIFFFFIMLRIIIMIAAVATPGGGLERPGLLHAAKVSEDIRGGPSNHCFT